VAFPAIASINPAADSATGGAATSGDTAATSHNVVLPATVAPGDFLMIFGRVASTGGTVTVPGGWTVVQDTSDGSNNTQFMAWKDTLAVGNEDGTNVSIGHSSAKMAAISIAVPFGENPAVRTPERSTVAVGTSTTPDPTTVTPTGGAKDYLFIWFGGWEGEQTLSKTAPTNYTDRADVSTGTGGAVTSNCQIKIGDRQLNASSTDPGSLTLSASDDWTAWAIAIHPQTSTPTPGGALAQGVAPTETILVIFPTQVYVRTERT
jgi:hypothetical protein